MENKIQQLTNKLFSEGVQKGNTESEKIIEQAKQEAAKIVSSAKAEAEKILSDAQAKEQELSLNTNKELVLAGNQMIADVKSSVRETVLKKLLKDDLSTTFNNPTFVGSLIEQMVVAWAKGATVEVPSSMESDVTEYLKGKLSSELSSGMVIKPSSVVKTGFKVEMEGGHYHINFGEEEFASFLSDYLRPKVAKIIFGEE